MKIPILLPLFWLAVTAGLACATGRQEPPPVDEALKSGITAWIRENGRPPEQYVVGLFTDHDVVFLGEQHRVKHDELFVQSLMKPLYVSGVRVLATEFGRREDQPLIDSLLAAPEWNETLARDIVFSQFVWWGYREYVDIYKAAWSLNRSLPKGAPRFRVIGINDSPDWSLITKPEDRDKGPIMQQVWRGGGEDKWAAVILDAVNSGEKVLVHCGIHHAFTKYRQPIVIDGKFIRFDSSLRCGNHVYNAIGQRTATVYLHAPWNGAEGYGPPLSHPADGVIDAVMLAGGPRPVGFDLAAGPIGELRCRNAVYVNGYPDFKLRDFCDGWIYTKPISRYEGVTAIADWVNEENLARARAQSPNPRFRNASAADFNKGVAADADVPRRWAGYLH